MGRLLYNYLLTGISLLGISLSFYILKDRYLDYKASKNFGNGRFFVAKESLRRLIFKLTMFVLFFTGSLCTLNEDCFFFSSIYFYTLLSSFVLFLDTMFDIISRNKLISKHINPDIKNNQ